MNKFCALNNFQKIFTSVQNILDLHIEVRQKQKNSKLCASHQFFLKTKNLVRQVQKCFNSLLFSIQRNFHQQTKSCENAYVFFLYSELILCKLDSGSSGFSVRYGIRGIELKRYSGHAASISSIGYVTHTVLYLVLGGCLSSSYVVRYILQNQW